MLYSLPLVDDLSLYAYFALWLKPIYVFGSHFSCVSCVVLFAVNAVLK